MHAIKLHLHGLGFGWMIKNREKKLKVVFILLYILY